MGKRMIYLINLIAEMAKKLNIPKTYSSKFIASGNEYLSPTEKIRIEDMNDFFVTAGIVGRTDILPVIGKDGYEVIEFEPDIIGGQYFYSPTDLITVQAGVPTLTKTGSEISSIEQLEAKAARIIAASIENRFERQCAQVYLKGTYTDKDGKVLNVGTTGEESKTWATKSKYSDELLKLCLDYQTKYGEFPKVEVGLTVFNALKNEANDTRQNINNVRFVFGATPYLEVSGQKIDLLVDAKGVDNVLIDTKDLVILSTTSNLAVGYGCLQYGDVKSNASKLVKAKTVAGDLRVESMTGSSGLWGKSAPMPLILNTNKFKRYKIAIS